MLGDPNKARILLQEALKKDPYLTEKAPNLNLFLDIDAQKLDGCNNAAEVGELETTLIKGLTDVKTVITALRRSMKDLW